jgi:hypothetical protein
MKRAARRMRFLPLCLLVWAGGWMVWAAQPAAAPSGPVVELPKFEVTDSRLLPPPESWRYAEIPGFEILSNMSAGATKRFVADFHLLQQAVAAIMPGLAGGTVPVPTALILCSRGNSFDQFVPDDQSATRFGSNSLFFHNAERTAIVVDFAIAELQLEGDRTVESDPYRAFYREYFRHLIRRQSATPPPVWFEEGLVQIFSAIDFNRKWITFAQIGDGFGGEKTGDFNRLLAEHALIPMQELLESEQPRERSAYWSAQCYAFVHLCLYGENKKYQKPFLTFLQRAGREPITEELFKACFKMSYKDMGLTLRGYIGFTNYQAMQYTAKKGEELPAPPPVNLVDAPDAVVGRLKGEVLRLAGHGTAARNALIAPYVRGERDPRLLAALGLDEKLAGNDERARKFLEAAAAGKAVRARAWLELARLRFADAKAKPAAPGGKLTPAQLAPVIEALKTAQTQPPALAGVYALAAALWMASAAAPTRDQFAAVVRGVNLFPRDFNLLLQTTLLAVGRGFPAEARALAVHGVKIATEPAVQDRFRMLQAAVERDHPETLKPEPSKPAPAPAAK